MKKIYSIIKRSLTKKTLALFSLLVFLPTLIVGLFLCYNISVKTKGNLINIMNLAIINNSDSASEVFSRIDFGMNMVQSNNSRISKNLLEYSDDSIMNMKKYHDIEDALNEILKMSTNSVIPYNSTYFIVDEKLPLAKIFPDSFAGVVKNVPYYSAPVLTNNKGVLDKEWYKKTKALNNETYIFKIDNSNNILCMARNLYSLTEKGEYVEIGVLLIAIDISYMLNNFDTSKLTRDTVIAVCDFEKNVLYSNSHEYEGQNMADLSGKNDDFENFTHLTETISNNKPVLIHNKMINNNLSFMTVVPATDIMKMTFYNMSYIIVLFVLLVISGFVLAFFTSRIIVKPINNLANHMKEQKEFIPISEEKVREDEVGVIYEKYNMLMLKIKEMLQQVYEAGELEKESRLKMLQAQINPHFIYNTLDSICCISLVRDQADIAGILSSLANIMRYNLKDPDILVTIKQELNQINDYIAIQSFRDNNNCTFYTNVSSEVESFFIPKMILQPLVENSLFHGAMTTPDNKLEIKILFDYDDSSLYIKVVDNGKCEDITIVNRHLNKEINISKNQGGLGIVNIKERIEMKFTGGYDFHFEKDNDGNTVAFIKIPKI